MNDKFLIKVSFVCSLLGLLLLFIVTSFIEADEIKISEIDNNEDKDVVVRGKVISIKNFDNLAIVEIAEIKSVNVVVFDKKLINFKSGENVVVSGEVKDYKGKLEIVADKIKVSS